MSFAAPLALIALVAIPFVVIWYVRHQRARTRAAAAFVTAPLRPSVTPSRPRWRRHMPIAIFAGALVALIVAAARPQRTEAVPVKDTAVMLTNDISSSMASTDVSPSRLGAAEHAANMFLKSVPSTARVGLIQFNQKATVLQSPTTEHALVSQALSQLHAGGHTAIGDGLQLALQVLEGLKSPGGKRPPAAIVLISDGYSTTGADPLAVARQARAQHIPIYTVSVGTDHGTIKVAHGKSVTNVPVPIAPQQLAQIAQASGGQAFTAADAGKLDIVYAHLGAQLSHKRVKQEITSSFAGGGLVLLLIGGLASLRWFGRLV